MLMVDVFFFGVVVICLWNFEICFELSIEYSEVM